MNVQDAAGYWCPLARAQAPQVSEHGVVTGAITVNRGPGGRPDRDCYCIGPACMAWRWTTLENGYCGLAGRPQETKDHE